MRSMRQERRSDSNTTVVPYHLFNIPTTDHSLHIESPSNLSFGRVLKTLASQSFRNRTRDFNHDASTGDTSDGAAVRSIRLTPPVGDLDANREADPVGFIRRS